MDSVMENRLQHVLSEMYEYGPEVDFEKVDAEAEAVSKRLNAPVKAVVAVKYLAEHGPGYDEMLDNAWDVAFERDPRNDPNEEADDTLCPYEGCGGYESEADSHEDSCAYVMAKELLREWRGL